MKIRILPSAPNNSLHQFAATYVVNDTVVIDAGCIGFAPLAEQRRVRHVVLSHAHLDHVNSLPIFLDNVYQSGSDVVSVYGSEHVLTALREHFFNDQIWPDLCRLSREETPFLKLVLISDYEPIQCDGLTVRPVPLNHVIPTNGFVLSDEHSSVAFVSDTGPTDRIWEVCNQTDNLKAVFLEAAFPNSMQWLADKAQHLTPELFAAEARKLNRNLPLIAVHIKPCWYDTVAEELKALAIDNLAPGNSDQVYEF